MHGNLTFGVPNEAAFTDDDRFHAWTFTLSGDADVELSTELYTRNLDSVMYVYRRGARGWGQYIAMNDNHQGMRSRIAEKLEAGKYLVKVKAAHSAMRGNFAVLGACRGGGCPADVAPGECSALTRDYPASSGFAAGCATRFAAIVAAPVGPMPASCASLGDIAVAHYKEYWDNYGGYSEMAEEGVEPDVSVEHHPGAGTVVSVTLGGDEDAMSYVFDAEGKLIFSYQHNQSPSWEWFCEGEAADEPDESCANHVIGASSYRAQDVKRGSGVSGQGASLSPQVRAAIREYAQVERLGGAPVTYSFRQWGGNYNDGAEVSVSAEGHGEATYLVVGAPNLSMKIALRRDASGTRFVCRDVAP